MQSSMCLCFLLNVKWKDKKEIFSSICFLTIRFCVFAFADYVGFLRMGPLLCTYQHGMDSRMIVEVLLQNGAEVNAIREVSCGEWRDMIQRSAHEGARNEMLIEGMALAMADRIEPMVHG